MQTSSLSPFFNFATSSQNTDISSSFFILLAVNFSWVTIASGSVTQLIETFNQRHNVWLVVWKNNCKKIKHIFKYQEHTKIMKSSIKKLCFETTWVNCQIDISWKSWEYLVFIDYVRMLKIKWQLKLNKKTKKSAKYLENSGQLEKNLRKFRFLKNLGHFFELPTQTEGTRAVRVCENCNWNWSRFADIFCLLAPLF